MIKEGKLNILKVVIAMMLLTSSLMVLQIAGQSFFLLLQIALCVYMFFITKRVVIEKSFFLLFITVEAIISMAFSILSDMPLSYKKGSVYMTILLVIMYFVSAYVIYLLDYKEIDMNFIKMCIKVMFIVQMHWTIIQYVLFTVMGIDINNIIFVETLGMVKEASAYKVGNYFMPSGFCWHPSVLVPIVVLSYFMFESYYLKILTLLTAFLCRNSTALICILLCIGVSILRYIVEILRTKKVRKNVLILFILMITLGFGVAYSTGILDMIIDKIVYLLQRIFGLVNDHGSGDAHRRYYTEYFNVVDNSSIPQVLFGYGIGCSGYPFTEMFGQYGNHASWAVESDIMNILISRGIVGFVLYYGMLFYIAIRGFKISYKYLCTTFILIIGGITYNIQFDWLFFINIFMFYCVNKGINWFDSSESNKKEKLDIIKANIL